MIGFDYDKDELFREYLVPNPYFSSVISFVSTSSTVRLWPPDPRLETVSHHRWETSAANGGKDGFFVARFKLFGKRYDDMMMRESWKLYFLYVVNFWTFCVSENHPFQDAFSSHPIGKSEKLSSCCETEVFFCPKARQNLRPLIFSCPQKSGKRPLICHVFWDTPPWFCFGPQHGINICELFVSFQVWKNHLLVHLSGDKLSNLVWAEVVDTLYGFGITNPHLLNGWKWCGVLSRFVCCFSSFF